MEWDYESGINDEQWVWSRDNNNAGEGGLRINKRWRWGLADSEITGEDWERLGSQIEGWAEIMHKWQLASVGCTTSQPTSPTWSQKLITNWIHQRSGDLPLITKTPMFTKVSIGISGTVALRYMNCTFLLLNFMAFSQQLSSGEIKWFPCTTKLRWFFMTPI